MKKLSLNFKPQNDVPEDDFSLKRKTKPKNPKVNFPSQHSEHQVKELAQKMGISEKTVRRDLKETGLAKTRKEYLKNAQTRRETAFNLRQQGMKYKEIARKLKITINNAQQLVRRHQNDLNKKEEKTMQPKMMDIILSSNNVNLDSSVILESVIERHYKAYLNAYKNEQMDLAKIYQTTLKDLYTLKYGVYPSHDEEQPRWLAFWGNLAENYGS